MIKTHQAIAVLTAAAFISGCGPAANEGANEDAQATTNVSRPAILPTPDPPLDRQALLIAVLRAASAAATGATDAAAQRALDGKRFELRLRFGCPAAGLKQPETVEARGKDDQPSVRLSARPDVSLDDPLIGAVTDVSAFEAVEGFWIKRPWMLTPACPRATPTTLAGDRKGEAEAKRDPEPADEQKPVAAADEALQGIAIVQLFTPTDTRAGRRSSRPFEAVVAARDAGDIGQTGFDLVLAGRLRALPSGQVIACRAADPASAPDCLVSADFDQARMVHPDTRAIFASWSY